MYKGKIIILPQKQEKKVLIYSAKGEPLIVRGQRPIGFHMEGSNNERVRPS